MASDNIGRRRERSVNVALVVVSHKISLSSTNLQDKTAQPWNDCTNEHFKRL